MPFCCLLIKLTLVKIEILSFCLKNYFLQFGVGARKVAITKERKGFRIEKSSLNIGNFKIVTKADKEGFENKS